MSFFDVFKRILGIQRPENGSILPEERPRMFPDDRNEDYEKSFGFNVFSNPLEMQRYFEKEMENLMKSFGLPSRFFGTFDPFQEGITEYDDNNHPAVEGGNLRDRYLKPGLEKNNSSSSYADSDIDGKVNLGDVETLLQNDNNMTPYNPKPNIKFYGQSISTSTIRKPDGSIETRRTIQDKDGNKETVVTHKFGDKEYTVTTRVDKNGQQEITENLINMEQNEANELLLNKGQRREADVYQEPFDWSLFNKFFK